MLRLPTVYAIYNHRPEYLQRLRVSQSHWADEGIKPSLWRSFDCTSSGLSHTCLTPAEACCYLGHYTLWQHAKTDCLILEDDTMFCSDFIRRANAAMSSAPEWDLLYLGSTATHWRQAARISGPPGYGKYEQVYGTHCYAVKARALPILVDRMSCLREPVDLQLYTDALPHLRWYVCEPSLAGQWTYGPE